MPQTPEEELECLTTCFESLELLIGLSKTEKMTLKNLRRLKRSASDSQTIISVLQSMRERGEFEAVEGYPDDSLELGPLGK